MTHSEELCDNAPPPFAQIDVLHHNVERLMQQRAECDWKQAFQEAQRTIATTINTNSLKRAASLYVLYLFYHHGWGATTQDETRAMGHLQSASDMGYPDAGLALARHHSSKGRHRKAKTCLLRCNRAFCERDHREKEEFKDGHTDMLRLLKVIEEARKEENKNKAIHCHTKPQRHAIATTPTATDAPTKGW